MSFPSTFVDVQTAVMQKARLDPALDTQRVKDWINQTYTRVCVETEANVNTATMTCTAGAYSYTLPADVALIKQMQVRPQGTTSLNAPLIRTTLDELMTRRQSGGDAPQAGQATHYALLGIADFELWPTPAGADLILLYFVGFPTPLVANTDLPVLEEPYASKLLEYGALVDAGDFNGDPATATWKQEFDTWMVHYRDRLDHKAGIIPGQFHQWGELWVAPADTYGY